MKMFKALGILIAAYVFTFAASAQVLIQLNPSIPSAVSQLRPVAPPPDILSQLATAQAIRASRQQMQMQQQQLQMQQQLQQEQLRLLQQLEQLQQLQLQQKQNELNQAAQTAETTTVPPAQQPAVTPPHPPFMQQSPSQYSAQAAK